ncbi:MAG: PAC2 family protein [Chitinispirillaceae bacterium]|nr:PAC2 family protein [Chitinispirillaceae bacterium]
MKLSESIKFDSKPTVIAAWPGMGNVGLITVDYLRRKLDAKVFGEIDMAPFFIPDSIVVKDGIAQLPELPSSVFYYVKNPDVIIFESNAQVAGREGIMIIKMILDVLGNFSIKHLFTFAAFAKPMSHAEDSEVLAACNSSAMLEWVTQFGVSPMPDGFIAGLNGLLLGVAATKEIEAACLLGTIPPYAASLNYPKASLELVRCFKDMTSLAIDTTELEEGVQSMEQQFDTIEERIREFLPNLNKEEEEEIAEVEEEKVPHYVMEKIEKLFQEAAKDREKAAELKKELDRWNLFELYENRFLDLFKE